VLTGNDSCKIHWATLAGSSEVSAALSPFRNHELTLEKPNRLAAMPARHARPLRRKQLSTVVVVPLTKRVQSSLAVMRLDNSSRRRPRQTLRCSLGTSRHHQRRIYWKLGSNKTAAPACRQNAGRTIGLRMRQRHMCAPPLAAGTQLEHHHPSQARRQLQRRARSALGQLVRPGHRQCRSSPMEVTPRVCVPGPRLD